MTASGPEPAPVTGAWRPGDPPGRRRFAALYEARPHVLEVGGRLSNVTIAYETWGELDADRSNAVLVLHALTGDSHAAGSITADHPQPGWWDDLIGPGRAIDTDRYHVVCPNVLGGCQGTTGPASPQPGTGTPYGPRFPPITIRDQVVAEAALADALGIDTWAAVLGGSMGGMRVLEWIVGFPDRVARALVLAVGAYATAEQIALCSLQNRAIALDPRFRNGEYYDAAPGDGPHTGLALARGIGQLSYRTESEFDERFGRGRQGDEDPLAGGRFAVESYLEYQGDKLAWRFDANSYRVLSQAMNHHDVGRGRGGIRAALARVRAETVVAGISSDRLYPLRYQEEIAALTPAVAGCEVIESHAGHDGFLVEWEAVAKLVRRLLGT